MSPRSPAQQSPVQQTGQQQQQRRRGGTRSVAVTPQGGPTPATTRPPSPQARRGDERPLAEEASVSITVREEEPESEPTASAQDKNQAEALLAAKDSSDRVCQDHDSDGTTDRPRPQTPRCAYPTVANTDSE